MDVKPYQKAPALSSELWANVFVHMATPSERFYKRDDTNDWLYKRRQKEMHQLKLVCKLFRDVFASHSGLVQHLYLHQAFPARLLPSLLAWLQQSKSSLQTFMSAYGEPLADVVLAGLLTSEQHLKSVRLSGTTSCSTSLLAAFSRLEKCVLVHETADHLNLAPLRGLARLQHLYLIGRFQQLHHLAGLTQLECSNAEVLGVQEFAPTLRHLTIEDSLLQDMHTNGLSACTGLTQLTMRECTIYDSNDEVYLDSEVSLISQHMKLQTPLHRLHFSSDVLGANLKWIEQLVSLKDLSTEFNCCDKDVIPQVACLTNLTRLIISSHQYWILPHLLVDFQWHTLQALKDLTISKYRLHFADDSVLQLPHLTRLSFANSVTEHDPHLFLSVCFFCWQSWFACHIVSPQGLPSLSIC